MGQPSVIFLDEPTSGLGKQSVATTSYLVILAVSITSLSCCPITDASSALLVMNSLKKLVEANGVTVCAVIHQVSAPKQAK